MKSQRWKIGNTTDAIAPQRTADQIAVPSGRDRSTVVLISRQFQITIIDTRAIRIY